MNKLLKLAAVAGVAAYGFKAALRRRRKMDLTGRVVLITGGSRGLGLAMAREFAIEGARLALLARDESELFNAQRLLQPAEVRTYVCDVTDTQQLQDMLGQVQAEMGPVSVLVNNAGALTVGPESAMTEGDYEIAMRTMYDAPLKLMRLVVPMMKRAGEGRVVNIASFGGKVPVPHMAPYAAAKHALVGLSESLRTELATFNVFVTTVCPGMIDDGAPVNVLFRGKTREEWTWFSRGATSSMAADPVALAKRIVSATVNGEAAVIYPLNAQLMSAFHGLFPNLSAELATLAQRAVLPGDERNDGPRRGMELSKGDAVLAERMAIANAQGTGA